MAKFQGWKKRYAYLDDYKPGIDGKYVYYGRHQILKGGRTDWKNYRWLMGTASAVLLALLVITGFIGAFKAYADAVAIFGVNLNAAGMNTIVGYVYDMLYGDGGGYPSYASAAAIILFAIVLTITVINLIVSRKATDNT